MCEFENQGDRRSDVMMPLDQHSVNTCVLRTTAAFEDFVEVGKIAMVVALGPATLASQRAAGTSLLPLIVKHRIANSLQLVFFTHSSRVAIFDRFRDCVALLLFFASSPILSSA